MKNSDEKVNIGAFLEIKKQYLKPWEYEKMKNSDEKVNIGAFPEIKKQYLGGRDYSPKRE